MKKNEYIAVLHKETAEKFPNLFNSLGEIKEDDFYTNAYFSLIPAEKAIDVDAYPVYFITYFVSQNAGKIKNTKVCRGSSIKFIVDVGDCKNPLDFVNYAIPVDLCDKVPLMDLSLITTARYCVDTGLVTDYFVENSTLSLLCAAVVDDFLEVPHLVVISVVNLCGNFDYFDEKFLRYKVKDMEVFCKADAIVKEHLMEVFCDEK